LKAIPKPEIEHFKKFHLLDLMSARHLNYLREKSIVVSYAQGDFLFRAPRSRTMGYYLLEGEVQILQPEGPSKNIVAGSRASYCSLEDELPENASACAMSACRVLQLSRVLVEQYFSWSTTGEYKVVDLEQSLEHQRGAWMKPLLHSVLAKNLSSGQAETLFSKFSEERVRAGDVILKKGESNQFFYILKHGNAELVNAQGERKVLSVGDFFGDESLVPNAVSNIQVEMSSSGMVAKLNHDDFDRLIKDSLIKRIDLDQLSLMDEQSFTLIDVRLPAEYKAGHVNGSRSFPLAALQRRMSEFSRGRIYFITADSGVRGELAAYLMLKQGYRVFMIRSIHFPGSKEALR